MAFEFELKLYFFEFHMFDISWGLCQQTDVINCLRLCQVRVSLSLLSSVLSPLVCLTLTLWSFTFSGDHQQQQQQLPSHGFNEQLLG